MTKEAGQQHAKKDSESAWGKEQGSITCSDHLLFTSFMREGFLPWDNGNNQTQDI